VPLPPAAACCSGPCPQPGAAAAPAGHQQRHGGRSWRHAAAAQAAACAPRSAPRRLLLLPEPALEALTDALGPWLTQQADDEGGEVDPEHPWSKEAEEAFRTALQQVAQQKLQKRRTHSM
jgi:hypothetical protein